MTTNQGFVGESLSTLGTQETAASSQGQPDKMEGSRELGGPEHHPTHPSDEQPRLMRGDPGPSLGQMETDGEASPHIPPKRDGQKETDGEASPHKPPRRDGDPQPRGSRGPNPAMASRDDDQPHTLGCHGTLFPWWPWPYGAMTQPGDTIPNPSQVAILAVPLVPGPPPMKPCLGQTTVCPRMREDKGYSSLMYQEGRDSFKWALPAHLSVALGATNPKLADDDRSDPLRARLGDQPLDSQSPTGDSGTPTQNKGSAPERSNLGGPIRCWGCGHPRTRPSDDENFIPKGGGQVATAPAPVSLEGSEQGSQ